MMKLVEENSTKKFVRRAIVAGAIIGSIILYIFAIGFILLAIYHSIQIWREKTTSIESKLFGLSPWLCYLVLYFLN